jgi:hypothetical protein
VSAPAPSRLLVCADDARRASVRASALREGIDYLEIATADQLTLAVHFIAKATAAGQAHLDALLASLAAAPGKITVSGGVSIRGIAVTGATAGPSADMLTVTVDRTGDFSDYTLRIEDATAMDPAYAEVDFSFKAGCPSRFDCGPRDVCAPDPVAEPPIDYLAKDYASFRQALLDFLPTIAPDWRERHEADLMVTLVELLAYVGDLISYEQDAVATEAYLETARRRVSVRRHARLVDYRMHDGASARTFVHVRLAPGATTGTVRAGTRVLTRLLVPVGAHAIPHPAVLAFTRPEDQLAARRAATAVFETLEAAEVAKVLNTVALHDWGDTGCCIPRGATAAHLVGDLAYVPPGKTAAWRLRPGSRILFEEVAGPLTGLEADADPRHRQIVTLVRAEPARDPVLGVDLTRVEWHAEDALAFPVCVSVADEPGAAPRTVSVARGNLVLADHGDTLPLEWHPEDPGWDAPLVAPPGPGLVIRGPRPFRLGLREGPLAQRLPAPANAPASALAGASDPRSTTPQVTLRLGVTEELARTWSPAPGGLLDRDGFDPAFAVEVEDDLRATLRFGDDISGMSPADGSYAGATYRVGVGSAGNVGADALRHLLTTHPLPAIEEVRNPLPATGGLDPEPAPRVKRLAPDAFRAVQLRAVTEADYAAAAERHPEVSHARATFRWTGSWLTVFLTVDRVGGGAIDDELRASVLAWVEAVTQTGYDLELQPPVTVPLDLELFVCAQRGHLTPDVERAVLEALSSRPGGFFDPDRFTFGDPLYLSALLAAVEAVPGVDSVTARRFSRTHDDDPPPARPVTARNVEAGLIPMGRLEILSCDDDPSRPERGMLLVGMGGGT